MIIETTIALLFIFSALVMFHELGHFVVARMMGIKVEEFAFGFGPRLVRLFKRGDTEYTIHAFPLGGFVKLTGMEPGEEHIPDGFQAQAIWKRALVIFYGPFASFALAVIVFICIGVYWGFPNVANPQNRVGMVSPQTEAQRIGLKAGDTILEIDSHKITEGDQMIDLIHNKPGEIVTLVIDRNGKKLTKAGRPAHMIQYLGATWSFMQENKGVVEAVYKDSEAKELGIKTGDQIVSIDGRRITVGASMTSAIEAAGSKEVKLELKRDGKIVNVTTEPAIAWVEFAGVKWTFPGAGAMEVTSADAKNVEVGDELVSINGEKVTGGTQLQRIIGSLEGKPATLELKRWQQDEPVVVELSPTPTDAETGFFSAIGLLGFQPEPAFEKAGLGESVTRGLSDTWQRAYYLVKTLLSERIKEDVGGPIMIGKMTASSVALGPYWVLNMLGALSLSLAFINLIPIPVLDGGHLLLLGIEAIRRKRFTREQMQTAQLFGLALIGMLVVVVLFADVSKILGGKVPQ